MTSSGKSRFSNLFDTLKTFLPGHRDGFLHAGAAAKPFNPLFVRLSKRHVAVSVPTVLAKEKDDGFMKWRVVLERDDETGDWAVWCPELTGCTSAGETEEEALKNIQDAIELYIGYCKDS